MQHFTLSFDFTDLASFSKGSNALVLKVGSFASKAISTFDVLEGVALEGGTRSASQMELEEDISTSTLETTQASPELTTTLPPLTIDVPLFEGLIDKLLEAKEVQSPFFMQNIA